MRLFACPSCGSRVFFENLSCSCGAELAFDIASHSFVLAGTVCANRNQISCNWVAVNGETGQCRSCQMTSVTPDLSVPDNVQHWAEAERSKRWVLTNLARWEWFGEADKGQHPVFHMLAEETSGGEVNVLMGHADGVLTINVSEVDPAKRVARRESLNEPLRTMIGHFRHELAHFFFRRLETSDSFVSRFRNLFGDERADYQQALGRYYEAAPQLDWRGKFISAYASSHPHEDWAESFAHVLHLTDIVDSCVSAGLSAPDLPSMPYDAYAERDSEKLVLYGARIGIALNHTNRAMGLPDIYPFVHSDAIQGKFGFAHECLRGGPQGSN